MSDDDHDRKQHVIARSLISMFAFFVAALFAAVPNDLGSGMLAASRIRPLDRNGNPSAHGQIVFISLGTQVFVRQATADPHVNHSTLVFVNGASNNDLAALGLSEAQVQVACTSLQLLSLPDLGAKIQQGLGIAI